MTTAKPALTAHGLDWYPDGLGGFTGYRDTALVGTAFPQVVGQGSGKWFARRRGECAHLCSSRGKALRWVADGPEKTS